MRYTLVFTILLWQITILKAQSEMMDVKTKELIQKGKSRLITEANKLLEAKFPATEINYNDFEISTWANKTKVIVKYRRLIRFLSFGNEEKQFYYDLDVNLIDRSVFPMDNFSTAKFYQPNKEEKRKILFVQKHFILPVDGFINTIIETDSTYIIDLENDVAFGKYYIDKISGKEVMPPLQGSYMPVPFEEQFKSDDPLVEILD